MGTDGLVGTKVGTVGCGVGMIVGEGDVGCGVGVVGLGTVGVGTVGLGVGVVGAVGLGVLALNRYFD